MNEIHIDVELQPEGAPEPLHLPVLRLEGREQIGACYDFEVEVRHPVKDERLDIEGLVSQRATIRISVTGRDGIATVTRTVHGVVDEATDSLEPDGPFSRVYKLRIRPPFSELDRFVSQDIFVGASYPAVMKDKLEGAQFAADDFAFRLQNPAVYGEGTWGDGAPEALEQGRLVVQYRESDLRFISRLAEHVGISLFFEDDGEKERIVFADHPGGFAKREAPVPWKGDGDDHGVIRLARKIRSVKSDFYAYDYNYRTPTLSFQRGQEQLFDVLGGEAHLEVPSAGVLLDYAPNAKTPTEAAFLATIRADQEEGRRERYVGESVETSLFAGLRFNLSNHEEIGDDEDLLVVSIVHKFFDAASFEPGKQPEYKNDFEAVRSMKQGPNGRVVPYRAEARTPKPRISGVVTGIIHALSDSQLKGYQHIDAQGRYIVKLHFDQGQKVMPRMRMVQPHAGDGYGQHFPLRPGCEVVVGFLDGDPDRPIILGAVPNPVQQSPVTASKEKEPLDVNRIKTRSGVVIEISDGPTTR